MRVGEPYNPRKIFTGIWIPDGIIMHPALSGDAKICFGRLCWFAGDDGYCWPKQDSLARSIMASKRQTQRYINELIRAGFIAVRQRGLNKSNVYVFLWHESLEGSLRSPISNNPKEWSKLSTPENLQPDLALLEWTDPSSPYKEVREVLQEKAPPLCRACGGCGEVITTKVIRGMAMNRSVPCPNCKTQTKENDNAQHRSR